MNDQFIDGPVPGWNRQPDDGDVQVWFSDRGHVALECTANSKEEAHQKFMTVRPYKEMQE